MGIITLGIGPPASGNIKYILTSGLDIGAAQAVVPIFEAYIAIRLTASSETDVRLTASADVEIEP
jgi:hypothetical protein